jgi:GDP-L-fucose synthase
LFGKWDKFNPESSHLLPAIIKKISDAKKNNKSTIEIWGDGTVRREFMFAEDLCDFIAFAIDSYEKLPEIMNVGVGLDYSINEYYEVAARVIGFQGQFVHDLTKPVGMKQKLTDVSIQKTLAWSAKTSLEMGLEKTFQFYKERVDL